MRRLVAAITGHSQRRSSKSDAGPSDLSKDDKKHTTPHKSRSAFFRSLSRKVSSRADDDGHVHPPDSKSKRHPMPPVSTQQNQAPSSSSSSSGGPHTPDDDSSSFLRTALHNKARTDLLSDPWLPDSPPATDNPAFLRTTSHTSPSFLAPPVLPPLNLSQDDTEDESSDADSSDSEAPPPHTRPILRSPNTNNTVSHAVHIELLTPVPYFRALTANALQPPFSPPPLLDLPNLPVFPRSCNTTTSMPPAETLRSLMLKKKLFRKVQGQGLLSPVEELALAAYGPHRPAPPKRPSLHLDDIAIKDHKAVGLPSQGLKLWVNRPCFEDRMAVFLPDQDTGVIKPMRISGSGFGVAALEYSESLEILAGLYDPQDDLSMMRTTLVASPTSISPVSLSPSGSQHSSSPPSPSAASPSPPPPSLPPVQLPGPVVTPVSKPSQQPSTAMAPNSLSRPQAYKAAAPSPLRMETSSSPVLPPVRSILTSSSQTFLSSSSSTVLPAPTPTFGGAGSSSLTSVSTPTIVLSPTSPEMKSRPLSQPPATSTGTNAGAGTSKPGVRFAEEDKEDQIPLGYVLRIRQKREEKARFLRAERQRRAHEDERRKHEEERRKQEEEKRKWEAERAGWEKERRAMEEERKKRAYAEEVAASRSRRESQRFGSVPSKHGMGPDGNVMIWEGDRERDRERRGREERQSYSRPAYDYSGAPVGGSSPTASRRQTSEHSPAPGHAPQLTASSSMRNESPGSSRPPSIGGSGSASGSVRGSMYSTPPSSTPDVNSRERRESKTSRRTSNISDASQAAAAAAAYLNMGGYAAGGGYPWNMNIPPVPVMPIVPVMPYMMDMPLLPPNPPFMLQQFGRPHSPSSSSHHNHNSSNGSYNSHNNNRSQSSSPAPGSHRLPASQSLERVNLGGQRHGSGNGPGHERRSSGDVGQIRRDRDRERDYKERDSSRDARTRESSRGRDNVRGQSYDRQSLVSGGSRNSSRTQLVSPKSPPPSAMRVMKGGNGSRTSLVSPTSGSGISGSPQSPSRSQMQSQQQQQQYQQQYQGRASAPIKPIPVMTSSWTQPAFQNLSRPATNRRSTMLS